MKTEDDETKVLRKIRELHDSGSLVDRRDGDWKWILGALITLGILWYGIIKMYNCAYGMFKGVL